MACLVALACAPFGEIACAQKAEPGGAAAAADMSEIPAPPPQPSPAAQAILATNPTLPWECARAAKILADLGEFELAKGFLGKILNELNTMDPRQKRDTLVDFEARFDLQMFWSMAMRPELRPESRELHSLLLQALDEHRRDPDRLAGLIRQMTSEDARVVLDAIEGLRQSGPFAVEPIVSALLDSQQVAAHSRLREVVRQLGRDAQGPLLALLEAEDAARRQIAIELLGLLRSREAGLFLIARAWDEAEAPTIRQAAQKAVEGIFGVLPSKVTATTVLVTEAEAFFRGQVALLASEEETLDFWSWDRVAGRLRVDSLPAHQVAKRLALRLAQDAGRLAPNSQQAEILVMAIQSEIEAGQGSLHEILAAANNLRNSWQQIDEATFERLLRYCLADSHPLAASVAVALAKTFDEGPILLGQGPEPSALVQALRHEDRRVRVVTLETVLQFAGDKSFAGASWVDEALQYFLNGQQVPRAVVAVIGSEEAMRIAGYLIDAGYQVDVVRSGREVLRLLTTLPDYELALVDAGIDQPPVELLLHQLRADCRSAMVPVGIIARAGQLDRAKHIAGRFARTECFARPHDPSSAGWQVAQLRRHVGPELLTAAERKQVVQRLLSALGADITRMQKVVDLAKVEQVLISRLNDADLAPEVLNLLPALGTPASQRAMLQLINRSTCSAELRRQAVKAFQESVERHRVLLTSGEILRQYDLYNQLGPISDVDREILGQILDAIEGVHRGETQEVLFRSQPGGW